MTFTRTNSGIGNRARFSSAQFTVYVENDPRCDPSQQIDSGFWRQFFRSNFPEIGFNIQAVGGKKHVKALADKIIAGSIPNALCALDRDYDGFYGDLISDERVFYTFGYGVENDALHVTVISDLYYSIFPGSQSPEYESEQIIHHIIETSKRERSLLFADQLCHGRCTAALDREKPTSDIIHQTRELPVRLRRKRALGAVTQAKHMPVTLILQAELQPNIRFIPSHHYFEIVFYTISRYIGNLTNIRMRKDLFVSIILSFWYNNFPAFTGDIREYYMDMARRDICKYHS